MWCISRIDFRPVAFCRNYGDNISYTLDKFRVTIFADDTNIGLLISDKDKPAIIHRVSENEKKCLAGFQ